MQQAELLNYEDYVFPIEAKEKWKNSELIKAIHRSQHTQRNYDLSKTIPVEDIKTIITSATQCPSKQNVAFYDLHVITNQELIFEIYKTTTNIHAKENEYNGLSNPQVLANMLLIFSEKNMDKNTNHREVNMVLAKKELEINKQIVNNDRHVAVGIAAGYVNLAASLLGYETGCCSCVMNYDLLKKLIHTESQPILLMGVGFKNDKKHRRLHPLSGTIDAKENNWVDIFKSTKKEGIKIHYFK